MEHKGHYYKTVSVIKDTRGFMQMHQNLFMF